MEITTLLSTDQLERVKMKSNWRGLWLVLCQWGIVVATFTVCAYWTHPVSIVIGTLILGSRLLGFFILTHECGHRTLFASPHLNEWVSGWLLAPLDFTNGRAYMREHLQHHRAAGTDSDPDIQNYVDYPITRERLKRKIKRDITGQTGWRNLKFKLTALAHLNKQSDEDKAALLRGLMMNALLLGVLWYFGHAWMFLMWVAALVFVQPVVVRIRQIAEHAAVPQLDSDDPRLNTRTLYANVLERLFICPHQVNYHIEHHLLASVPIYRLKALHKMLLDAGYYTQTSFLRGYADMLRQVTLTPQSNLAG